VRTLLIKAAIIAAGVAIAWLFAGRRISLVLDRVMTVRFATLPTSPLVYDGSFRIGELSMDTTAPNGKPFDMSIHFDTLNRLVLTSGGRSFTLGPRTSLPSARGRPDVEFMSEPGDETSFVIDRSCMSWPNPFETNFMTGHTPTWKRYLYYRWVWKKRSGAKLEMVWRLEQWFYSIDGWGSRSMLHENSTGLIRVDITLPQ
jgi:hypothetical protein